MYSKFVVITVVVVSGVHGVTDPIHGRPDGRPVSDFTETALRKLTAYLISKYIVKKPLKKFSYDGAKLFLGVKADVGYVDVQGNRSSRQLV